MKKKKILIKANIKSNQEIVKEKLKKDSNIFILEKNFTSLSKDPSQKEILIKDQKKNSNVFLLKKNFIVPSSVKEAIKKSFILEKKFKVIKNTTVNKNNVFNIKIKSDALLEVKKISKSLGNKPILKNISLTLEPGKIVGLLGPNGSGKTTLFNLIIGKIFPDQGTISLNKSPIHTMPIHLRSLKGISLLEQHKGLFGNMTAEDNLYSILELHMKDKEEINNKIDNLLNYFDLRYLKKTKANLLSGGEYKKISILQRICNPNISTLLLDEPCAALDPLSINSLKKFIVELKKIGLSILITDHNYWAIENILDKAYLIKSGEILVEGTTEKISNDKDAIKYYLGGNFKF